MDDGNQGKSAIPGGYEQMVVGMWFLVPNEVFGRNNQGRGNTEEQKEKDFTISYDKVFSEIIFD